LEGEQEGVDGEQEEKSDGGDEPEGALHGSRRSRERSIVWREPHAQDDTQVVDVVREIIIHGNVQVPADGVEAVVTLPRAVHIEYRPALEPPVAQHPEDGRKVNAAAAEIVIDARHAVLLLRRRGGVAAIFGVSVLE